MCRKPRTRTNSYAEVARLVIVVAFGFVLCGCLVPPLPLARRIELPDGTRFNERLDFIKPGVTTRADVEKRLGSMDTGALSGAFWGRFNESSFSDPSGERVWSRRNLIIDFDDRDLVRSMREIKDEQLATALVAWFTSHPNVAVAPAPSRSMQARWKSRCHSERAPRITLGSTGVVIAFRENGDDRRIEVPGFEIAEVWTAPYGFYFDQLGNKIRSSVIEFSISFNETAECKVEVLQVDVTPHELVGLLNFIRQHCPNARYASSDRIDKTRHVEVSQRTRRSFGCSETGTVTRCCAASHYWSGEFSICSKTPE